MKQARYKILLVEDDKIDQIAFERLVKRENLPYDYEIAGSVAAARNTLARERFDAALVDFFLGDGTALDLLDGLKGSPTVILTGGGDEAIAVQTMKAGAIDYMIKDPEGHYLKMLPKTVENAIFHWQTEEELKRYHERLEEMVAERTAELTRANQQLVTEIAERKRAEERLAEERNLLRTLIDNLPDYIFVKDIESRFVVNNLAHVYALGAITPAEVIGKTDLDLFPRKLAEQYLNDERVVISFGQTILNREEIVEDQRTGNQLWVSTSKVPLRDRQGNITGLVGVSRDITEQKRAEGEIRRHNRELELLNAIIAASASGMEQEVILETACRQLALTFDLPRTAAIWFNKEKTEATVVAEYLTGDRPALIHSTTLIDSSPSFQYLLTHQSSLVVEDVRNDPRLAPVRDLLRQRGVASLLMLPLIIEREVMGALSLEAAEPYYFSPPEVSLGWSVADQVAGALARVRIETERRLLSSAIEQSTEGVVILNADRTIRYANPGFEQMTGYSWAEAIGREPNLLLHSDKQDPVLYEEMWAIAGAGKVWQGRIINRRKDGSLLINETILVPVRNEQGDILNYVELKRDVTQELQLEEQYHQAQKMEAIGQLAGGIAHDFNNILVPIIGYAELGMVRAEPDSAIYHDMKRIYDAGHRAAALTQQILAFSRKQMLEMEFLDLNDIVIGTEKMLQRLIGENIEWHIILAPSLGQVKADRSRVEQILMNLVVNARDAMPAGGRLTLETHAVFLDESYAENHIGVQPGPYVMLVVSDTGIGMDAATKERIFEPFFTTKPQGKGTGLGLATVFGLVKQHGGNVWVYSEPGMGTSFKIYLPQATEGEASTTAAMPDQTIPVGGTETVLVAEDEDMVRHLVIETLTENGYTVLESQDPDACLQLVADYKNTIHLLLTDVVMPHLNGRELHQKISEIYPDIKVLYISGYTHDVIAHHGVLEQGVNFLQKPFSTQNLLLKVRQILDQATVSRTPNNLQADGSVPK